MTFGSKTTLAARWATPLDVNELIRYLQREEAGAVSLWYFRSDRHQTPTKLSPPDCRVPCLFLQIRL